MNNFKPINTLFELYVLVLSDDLFFRLSVFPVNVFYSCNNIRDYDNGKDYDDGRIMMLEITIMEIQEIHLILFNKSFY